MLLLNSKSLEPRDAASLVPSLVILLLSVLPGLVSLGGRLSAQVVRAQHLGLGGAAHWSGGEAPHPCPHQARHGHPRPQEGHHCRWRKTWSVIGF